MNTNDKYFYGKRGYILLYTCFYTFVAVFFTYMFNTIPKIYIHNYTVRQILPILFLPINIFMLYITCILMVNFWDLFVIRKPLAIVREDSVSIFEGVRNSYACIKFKDIKGIKQFSCNTPLLLIDVDNFDFYYNQYSNIFVKFCIRLKQTKLIRNTYKQFHFTTFYNYISFKDFDDFENLVIKGANKYRNEIIEVR